MCLAGDPFLTSFTDHTDRFQESSNHGSNGNAHTREAGLLLSALGTLLPAHVQSGSVITLSPSWKDRVGCLKGSKMWLLVMGRIISSCESRKVANFAYKYASGISTR